MLTPQALRANAWSKLQSADALLASGNFDEASYLAGYVVELSLKARFCTRKGLADFPADRDEAKQRGLNKLLTHDLQDLLTLSDGQVLQKSSMSNIDWDKAMDWSEQQRYAPIGTATHDRVLAQLAETRKLFIELVLFEIVEKMLVVEKEVSAEKGDFSLFAVSQNATQRNGWEVFMSAWWLDSQVKLEDIRDRGVAILDADLAKFIVSWGYARPDYVLVRRFHQMINGLEHHPRCLTSNNVIIDRIMPPAYLITSRMIPQPAPKGVGG